MTIEKKNELIVSVTALLERMIPVEEPEPTTIIVSKSALPEMLVKHNKVKYIRCSEGARGKILVSKESLICQRHRYCKKIETVLSCPVQIITSQSDHG